mmetsp:Transcript_5815/g.8440  ORF Transcript_5815/g.8440 Transcript_5815/m.8440 type:complete len:531 (-) Transcript_5815:323-1915(-)
MNLGDKEFHIAPMIDVSTIEFRYFMRLLTKRAVIWNQMVVAETLVYRNKRHEQNLLSKEIASCEVDSSSTRCSSRDEKDNGDVELTPDLEKFCGWYDDSHVSGVSPHPTVCQLGSNIPSEATFATRIAEKCGYDAIDLNSECPSDRVAGRCFGAALMKQPDIAVDVVSAMVENTNLPVSVKTRIGVDEHSSFEYIASYIKRLVEEAGCKHFIIHARKVYLEGLMNPAENRTIPPLNYPIVYRLCKQFPDCSFIINGGISGLEMGREVAYGNTIEFNESGIGRRKEINTHESDTDDHDVPCQKCNLPQGSCLIPPLVAPSNLQGVMVGRLARDRPADLHDIDRYYYGEKSNPVANRRELMEKYISFLERVYPRRCCDDDETCTLGMVKDMSHVIIQERKYCDICREFRGQNDYEICDNLPRNTDHSAGTKSTMTQTTQSGRRSRRHMKYENCKIVSRIIDRALAPTHNILTGIKGKKAFLQTTHNLSRDKKVRNCGAAYILYKAMQSVNADVWDKPFELSGAVRNTYYPSK